MPTEYTFSLAPTNPQQCLFEVFLALRDQQLDKAEQLLQQIRPTRLNRVSSIRYHIMSGEIALKRLKPRESLEALLQAQEETTGCSWLEPQLLANISYLTGQAYYDAGQFLDAYKQHQAMLSRLGADQNLKLKLYNSLSMELILLGDYTAALNYLNRAAALGCMLDWPEQKAQTCMGLLVCKGIQGQFNEASSFGHKGLKLLENKSEPALTIKLHHTLSQTLMSLEKYPEAEYHQQKATEDARRTGNSSLLVVSLIGLAQLQVVQDNLEAAQQNILVAETASSEQANIYVLYGLVRYAEILAQRGYYDEAETAFQRGFSYIDNNRDAGTAAANFYASRAEALVRQGKHHQAIQFFRQAIQMKDYRLAKISG